MTQKGHLLVLVGLARNKRGAGIPSDAEISRLHKKTVAQLNELAMAEARLTDAGTVCPDCGKALICVQSTNLGMSLYCEACGWDDGGDAGGSHADPAQQQEEMEMRGEMGVKKLTCTYCGEHEPWMNGTKSSDVRACEVCAFEDNENVTLPPEEEPTPEVAGAPSLADLESGIMEQMASLPRATWERTWMCKGCHEEDASGCVVKTNHQGARAPMVCIYDGSQRSWVAIEMVGNAQWEM